MDAETAALFDGKSLPDLVKDTYLKAFISNNSVTHYYKESAGRNTVPRKETWQIKEQIGRGGYSVVRLEECAEGRNSRPINRAVKEITMRKDSSFLDYSRELETFAKFSQAKFTPFFVRSFGWFHAKDNICIALEYFPLGDLGSYLRENPRLSEKEAKDVIYQVLEGLDIMHSEGFAHRDLKPENILLKSKPPSDTWSIRLTDFGLSKRITSVSGVTAQRGTEGYLSPEILFPRIATGYDLQNLPSKAIFASDIWSLGEITFRILSQGQPSFRFQSELLDYTESRYQFPIQKLDCYKASFQGKSFILRLMAIPYDRRSTAKAAMQHDWMTIPDFSKHEVKRNINQAPHSDQKGNTRMSTRTNDIDDTRGWTSTGSLSTIQADTPLALNMRVALQPTSNTPIAKTTETVAETPLPSVESDVIDSNSASTQTTSLISIPTDQIVSKKDIVYVFEQGDLKQFPKFPITNVKNDGTSGLKAQPIEFPAAILQQQAWIDSTSLAVFCADGCLYVEDMISKSRTLKRKFDHSSVNAEVAFSSDARWIVICTSEKAVAYDIEDEEKSVSFDIIEANLQGFTFSKDNKLLACIMNQGRSGYSAILVWILNDQVFKTRTLKGSIVYLKFMHNSDELVAVARDGHVYFIDMDIVNKQRRYLGVQPISSAVLSQTDSDLSVKSSGTITVVQMSLLKNNMLNGQTWKFSSSSLLAMTKSSNTNHCAVYLKEQRSSATYQCVQVYESTTSFNKPIFEAAWPHDSIQCNVAVAGDSSWLALPRNSQTISWFGMNKIEASLQLRDFLNYRYHSNYFAPDGKTVLSTLDRTCMGIPDSRFVLVWDVESGHIHTFLNDWAVDFTDIYWSSNSDSVAIVLKNRHVQTWHFAAGCRRESTHILHKNAAVSRIVFAPDLRFMAVKIMQDPDIVSSERSPQRLPPSSSDQLRLHFLHTNGHSDDLTLKNSIIGDMAFSSDGQRLVVLVLARQFQLDDHHDCPLLSIRIYSIQNTTVQIIKTFPVFVSRYSHLVEMKELYPKAFKLALPPSGDVVILSLLTGEVEVSEIANIQPSHFASAPVRQHIHSWFPTEKWTPGSIFVILSPDHALVVFQNIKFVDYNYHVLDLVTFVRSTKLIYMESMESLSNEIPLTIHQMHKFQHWYDKSVAKNGGREASTRAPGNVTFLENPPRKVQIVNNGIRINGIHNSGYNEFIEFLPLQRNSSPSRWELCPSSSKRYS